MSQSLVLVRAWEGLAFSAIQALVPAQQAQFDEDLLPAWQAHGATAVTVSAADIGDIPNLDPACWPIFINRHSSDAGALGWHDDESGRIFGRVFWGDCLRYGLDPGVTVSHEACELIVDPTIDRTATVDGLTVALEVCDPCEDDEFAYEKLGVKVSDFVLPSYFGLSGAAPFDFGKHLTGSAPALLSGGYISEDVNGSWTQVQADRRDGMASARALMRGFRRTMRARRG